ncbi:hypothetical protein Cpir12675_000800 [Ceratocystis pirilliformis]|uniref:Mtf2-like C-terminal domain-containing protein n=1 Tax=Ceratocystis pirilliformis TaxID=259994 RepID=A0ABR3ZJD1_9PEZI
MSRALRLPFWAAVGGYIFPQTSYSTLSRSFSSSAARRDDLIDKLSQHQTESSFSKSSSSSSATPNSALAETPSNVLAEVPAEAPADSPIESPAETFSALDSVLPERTVSTITPTEKRVFGEIFDSLATTKQTKVSSLFKKSPQRRHRNPWSREEILQMYPPSLRLAVESSFLEENRARDDDLPEAELTDAEKERLAALDTQRVAEVQRVKALFEACRSDKQVWTVLEKEVFLLVQKLGIAPDLPDKTSPTPDTAALEVHGPIFPQHILTAAQRLVYDFTRPSPLALAILPRLKQLGLAAYVLGASTPLYDELLRVSWALNGSIPDIIDLLSRMRDDGLAYSADTLRAVDEVASQIADVKDAVNNFAEPALGMPAFDVQARKALMKEYSLIESAVKAAREETDQEVGRRRY